MCVIQVLVGNVRVKHKHRYRAPKVRWVCGSQRVYQRKFIYTYYIYHYFIIVFSYFFMFFIIKVVDSIYDLTFNILNSLMVKTLNVLLYHTISIKCWCIIISPVEVMYNHSCNNFWETFESYCRLTFISIFYVSSSILMILWWLHSHFDETSWRLQNAN